MKKTWRSDMKKTISGWSVLLLMCLFLGACGKKADTTVLPEWNPSSQAMESIIGFVKNSVDEKSEGYIPVQDRIAVFDMDGTLTCETFYTYYDTMMFIEFCLK